jgi:hypothetical protein
MYHGGGRSGVTFVGTKGKVMTGRGHCSTEPREIMAEPIRPDEVRLYRSHNHGGDFLNCVRTRKRPVADVEIGCSSVTVCHLGNIAYWLKRPIKWDPVKGEIIGDEEANRWVSRPMRAPWVLEV